MTGTPIAVAVPAGTAPYWHALLQRSGLPTCGLEAATSPSSLFLPDAAGTRSPALRRQVARLLADGATALVGPAWSAHVTAGPRVVRVALPAADRLLRPAAHLRALPSPGGRAPREVLATVDHGALRRWVEATLRALAFAAHRPFVRLAHLPVGHDAGLAIRIDADSFRRDATMATLAALAAARLRATWFVDVARHGRNGGLDTIAAMQGAGHEVQSHGYRHYTYRSRARNEHNLRRSLAVLGGHGVLADAVAAPFGTWNRGFDAALRALGLRWSSEFARVHDDVPGPLAGTADEPWQVPIHPVCPALLFAAGADRAAVHAWFADAWRESFARGECAVFYGHPIDDLERCPELLPAIAARARGDTGRLWQPTLGDLHAFYRERAAQPPHVALHGDALRGRVDGRAPLLVERAGQPTVAVHGEFALPLGERSDQPVVLVPAPRRRPLAAADRLATRRLQLARWLREIRS